MVALIGPTSSGKTSLALKLAEKFNFDIVSFDSRQVYKSLDVGTGKIPVGSSADLTERLVTCQEEGFWDVNGIRIWMYDLVYPRETYSVARYIKDLKVILPKVRKRSKIPLFVGGTGHYLNAILNPIETIDIKPNPILRKSLETKSVATLLAILPREIAKKLNNSEKNNKQRLIRRIEIQEHLARHSPIQSGNLRSSAKVTTEDYNSNLIIGLTAPREVLYKRVDKWVDEIWYELLIEIADIAKDLHFNFNYPVFRGLVYSYAVRFYLESKEAQSFWGATKKVIQIDEIKSMPEVSEEEAKQKIKYNLHAYIRRQLTYFIGMDSRLHRNDRSIRWFDITGPNYELDITSQIKYYLGKHGN